MLKLHTGFCTSEWLFSVWTQFWLIHRFWGNARPECVVEAMELEFICEVGCDWCSVDDKVPVFDGKMIDGLQIVNKNKL